MSKTIKQLADELNVSKTAIRNRFTDEFCDLYIERLANNVICISDEGCKIISETLQTCAETTANQPQTTEKRFAESSANLAETTAKLPQSSANQPQTTVNLDEQLLETLQSTIDMLQQQLISKDKQIEALNVALNTAQQTIADTTAALTAAQALHAGTLQRLTTAVEQSEGDEIKADHEQPNQYEQDQPKKKGFLARLFGK